MLLKVTNHILTPVQTGCLLKWTKFANFNTLLDLYYWNIIFNTFTCIPLTHVTQSICCLITSAVLLDVGEIHWRPMNTVYGAFYSVIL